MFRMYVCFPPPLAKYLANVNKDISIEEINPRYRYHNSIVILAFLIKFVFGEFMALLLGGALNVLGGPFNLFALLIFLFLRVLAQAVTVALLRNKHPLVSCLKGLLHGRRARTTQSAA